MALDVSDSDKMIVRHRAADTRITALFMAEAVVSICSMNCVLLRF